MRVAATVVAAVLGIVAGGCGPLLKPCTAEAELCYKPAPCKGDWISVILDGEPGCMIVAPVGKCESLRQKEDS